MKKIGRGDSHDESVTGRRREEGGSNAQLPNSKHDVKVPVIPWLRTRDSRDIT